MLNKKNKALVKHFEELITPIYELLYRFIFCILKNKSLSEDALQNTLLKAYSHLPELNDEKKFKNWIFTIAKHESINVLRSYRKEVIIDFDNCDTSESADMEYLDNYIIKDEIKNYILETIKSLKPEDRDILILRYYNDLTLNEISQVLNINYNTVRTRHRCIKKKICEGLKSKGLI